VPEFKYQFRLVDQVQVSVAEGAFDYRGRRLLKVNKFFMFLKSCTLISDIRSFCGDYLTYSADMLCRKD
jgi:hypothetical protein